MEYTLELVIRKERFLFLVLLLLLLPILGYIIMSWKGIVCSILFFYVIYLIFPRWIKDYPLENMEHTLKVLKEFGKKNGWVLCAFENNKQLAFYKNEYSYKGKRYPSVKLMFKKSDWECLQNNNEIDNLCKKYHISCDVTQVGDVDWLRFSTKEIQLQLKIIREVTGKANIPYIKNYGVRMKLEDVFIAGKYKDTASSNKNIGPDRHS